MRQQFHAEQWLPFPTEVVFAFFASPANLPPLMPRWQRVRIQEVGLQPPPAAPPISRSYTAIIAGDGTRLTLSFRIIPFLPVRLSWVARIENFQWNKGFSDLQLRGPFRYWHHCHSVTSAASPSTGSPGTHIEDRVEYELPLGDLGRIANALAVRRQIASLFRYRHHRTSQFLPEFAARHAIAGTGSGP